MEREQFTFYRSFAKALSFIRDEADRCKAYDAVCNYALYGIEPENLPDNVAMAFELIRPTLDSAARKAAAGKLGGESKQTGSKSKQIEANGKQGENESKTETRGNAKQTESKKEKEIEKEIEIENKSSNKRFVPPTLEEVKAYCRERNSPVDPNEFYEYFTAGNWYDAKGQRVTRWKQKLITWEKFQPEQKPKPHVMTPEEEREASRQNMREVYEAFGLELPEELREAASV